MSLKLNASTLESSQGFKKRILRPVSTNKHTNPITEIKNKSLVNLKDTLSLKSKYSQVQRSIQALTKDIQPSLDLLKSFNQIKVQKILRPSQLPFSPRKLILRLKQNVCDKNIPNLSKQNAQKQGSIHGGASFYDVGNRNQTRSAQIIQQLKIQSIQDGLNFLYGQNLELNNVIEKCTYFLGGCLLNHCEQQKQPDNQDSLQLINGNQDSLQLLTKLISVVIKKFLLPKTKNETQTQSQAEKSPQESPKIKFKTIFTARKDPQQEEEVKKLNQQLERIKEQKSGLEQKLKNIGLTIKDKLSDRQGLSIRSSQKIHNEIRLIYDEALNKKHFQISKLNQQKSELQEKLTRKQTSQSFNQLNKKQVFESNIATLSGFSCQNSEFSEFVQQEMQNMRQGFIKKLQKIQGQFIEKQNKLKKDIFKIEKDYENVQFQKRIILKKYDFLLLSDE